MPSTTATATALGATRTGPVQKEEMSKQLLLATQLSGCLCFCLYVFVCAQLFVFVSGICAEGGDEQTSPAGDMIKWVFVFFVSFMCLYVLVCA